MNRFKSRFLVVFTSIVALAVIGAMGLSGGNLAPDRSLPGLGVALAAPALQTSAFPEEQAGFSAYLDVGPAIDTNDKLAEMALVCTTVPNFSQSHMLCEVGPANSLAVVNIRLYADTSGMVIAFFANDQPSSRAATWSGPVDELSLQPVFESPTLALDDIVRRAVERVGVDYEAEAGNGGYYNWRFPNATLLSTIVKLGDAESAQTYQFTRPNTPLFQASVTGYGPCHPNSVALNGRIILHTRSGYQEGCREDGGINLDRVGPDLLHKVDQLVRVSSAIYLLWDPSP